MEALRSLVLTEGKRLSTFDGGQFLLSTQMMIKKLHTYINSLMVVLPWWPTRLQISSDAQGFSSLHRLFILIFKSEDSYAWFDKHVKVSCPLPSCLGSSSRGHYQAIYQPPEGVYLLNLCITYLTHNALSDWLKIDFYFRLNQ